MKALSVRQPWAWLLFHGKPVENREWVCLYRGPLAIHAAKGMTNMEYEDAVLFVESFDEKLAASIPPPELLARGKIVGTVEMIGCVNAHPSPFFQGKYGFVFREPRELSIPIEARGALGLWEWSGSGPEK